MPTLLHLDSSIAGERSRTRALTRAVAESWRSRGDQFRVVHHDLHEEPPQHIGEVAQHWPERLRDGAELSEQAAAAQRRAVDELLAADVLLVGAPTYNFGLPSTLKAWIDLVHVPGLTVPFDEPVQPLRGRSAIVVTAQGGAPDETEDGPAESPAAHSLRLVLEGSFGMEVQVVGTSRTLADLLPDLDPARAAEEFARALDRARALGAGVR
ncbi:NAD(P)H-dependent oxidoreductase [Leucobacter weissii]|uniref:FMN dependent NADH:quinone oxidoreductase n=1 Tax=Leucobacter weissii TaxID=1983706 RepID=A0A939MPP1_9MICO|nr:NAD(P)H-dependent oxidoreductase [Leucobacter weissii]MBO1902657.1 NAD(P)H-dependent oxidoreductase [Leucobacter weissii]